MDNNVEEVEIFSNADEFLIMQVCAILKDNNIEYYKISDGNGAYSALALGKSFEMKRIIVSKENEDKARELIKFLTE